MFILNQTFESESNRRSRNSVTVIILALRFFYFREGMEFLNSDRLPGQRAKSLVSTNNFVLPGIHVRMRSIRFSAVQKTVTNNLVQSQSSVSNVDDRSSLAISRRTTHSVSVNLGIENG